MQCTCPLLPFRNAFNRTSAAVGGKSHNPTLQSVVVDLDRKQLIGTDNEVGIVIDVPEIVSIIGGKFLLPAGKMNDILSSINRGNHPLNFLVKETVIELVHSGTTKIKIPLEDASKHPGFDVSTDGDSSTLVGSKLTTGFRRTLIGTDKEQQTSSMMLAGVQVDKIDDWIELTSTNGRRILNQRIESKIDGEFGNFSRIIPANLGKLIADNVDGPNDVILRFNRKCSRVSASIKGTEIAGSLLAGMFPGWRPFAAKVEPTRRVLLNAEDLSKLVKEVIPVNSEASRRVRMNLSDGLLEIVSPHSQAGGGETQMAIHFDGPGFSTVVSGQFLVQVLDRLGDLAIEFGFSEPTNPVFVKTDNFTYILMPIAEETEVIL